MFDVSAVLLPNACETTSPFTDAWRLRDFPPRLAVYQVSNMHKVCCCSSIPRMASIFPSVDSIHCRCRFYSAVCSDWYCWSSYAETPEVGLVIKGEIRIANFRQVVPFCVIKSMTIELTLYPQQNGVEVCQRSCKLVKALWIYEQSNVVASVFWGPLCLSCCM